MFRSASLPGHVEQKTRGGNRPAKDSDSVKDDNNNNNNSNNSDNNPTATTATRTAAAATTTTTSQSRALASTRCSRVRRDGGVGRRSRLEFGQELRALLVQRPLQVCFWELLGSDLCLQAVRNAVRLNLAVGLDRMALSKRALIKRALSGFGKHQGRGSSPLTQLHFLDNTAIGGGPVTIRGGAAHDIF